MRKLVEKLQFEHPAWWAGVLLLLVLFSFFTSGSRLELCAVVADILCIWMLTKEKISTFFFGLLSAILFFFLFWQEQLYGSMSIQVYFVCMNIVGFYAWKQARKKNDGVHISKSLDINGWIVCGLFLGLGTFLLSVALGSLTDAKSTFLDSFLTVGSMVAGFLTVKKFIENWMIWIVLETCYIVLYVSHELYVACFMAIILNLLNMQGFLQWKKTSKQREAV